LEVHMRSSIFKAIAAGLTGLTLSAAVISSTTPASAVMIHGGGFGGGWHGGGFGGGFHPGFGGGFRRGFGGGFRPGFQPGFHPGFVLALPGFTQASSAFTAGSFTHLSSSMASGSMVGAADTAIVAGTRGRFMMLGATSSAKVT
jgi:hypothetical protein